MKQWTGLLVLLLSIFGTGTLTAATTNDAAHQADHQALRQLMTTCTAGINARDLNQLKSCVDGNFSLITVTNDKIDSFSSLERYWKSLFEGKKAVLKRITIEPVASSKTKFLSDDVGIVDGTATESYVFTDGDERTMTTRWSAVVNKTDGNWRIANIQFTANLLDNPVLKSLQSKMLISAIISFVIGLMLGIVITRRRKT